MATLEQMIRGFGTTRSSAAELVADPVDDDEDGPWSHELRLLRAGETIADVMREAASYRERTGTDP